ncbi:DUF3261 domain-containing protein [Acinetobacter sp. ANC 4648]|uniref:DUF3261 domain-containing protein n=1 Tax=Acinetobacter sp. ANC 4648 TaxID=1977875 RepID=UPI000A340ACB|nr:DUF3261 domain-containing protein [Acinetobacter sp. ANC 4648]OTG84737.1 DUF3261 domain-containing protein [Acinetobacter sp. ANC 4648]
MMHLRWVQIWLGIMIGLNLSGCQALLPKAQGLASSQWMVQSYQRQDLVEVQWQQHSFSFLLYQQQQGRNLDLVALSLTGQQLFKLKFDGQQVKVEQRIESMRLLPFDFVVRDVLFATYPNFAKLHHDQVTIQYNGEKNKRILINQQLVLHIHYLADYIELENIQVPYQMVFSAVPNTLENNE